MGNALKQAGYKLTPVELQLLFAKYNRDDKDEYIYFSEFIQELTPRTSVQF